VVLQVGPGAQGGVPVRVVVSEAAPARCPAVVWLHQTGGSTEALMPRLQQTARQGFVAVSMDCR